MKKYVLLLIGSLIIFSVGFRNGFAIDKEVSQKARIDAEIKIKDEKTNKTSDWYNQNPKIVQETLFYNYSDDSPSYIEYKISCKKNKDCGFIILNIDGIDVRNPMTSYSGKSLSEIMGSQKGSKNYYFNIFDQFSISQNGKISSANPMNQLKNNGISIHSEDNVNPLYTEFKNFQKEAIKIHSIGKSRILEIEKKVDTILVNFFKNTDTKGKEKALEIYNGILLKIDEVLTKDMSKEERYIVEYLKNSIKNYMEN